MRALTICLAVVGVACVACDGSIAGPDLSGSTDQSGGADTDGPAGDSGPAGTPDIVVRYGEQTLAPSSDLAIALGSTRFGGFSPNVELVIENTGSGALVLTPTEDAPFAIIGPTSVAAGETATLALALVPSAAGPAAGTVELGTNVAGKERFAFELSGNVLTSSGTPLNPYWTTAPWKLWFVDPTPVEFSGIDGGGTMQTGTFAPPAIETRKFPTPAALAASYPMPFLGLETAPADPASAGFWDDASGTMDNGHSGPWSSWSGTGNSINVTSQYIRIGFGSPFVTQRHALGLNFTSESYSQRGHWLSRISSNVVTTERDWFFSNTVRGTPSYLSFHEKDAAYATDNYDGLYGQSFHSLGRSSSEVRALNKMLVAGGFMPRSTKETLKRHGLYAAVMPALWLAYVAEDGSALPYENEMHHRVAYLSMGNGESEEFAPNNIVYHQYPDTLHMNGMVQGAKAMTTPPPFAALKVLHVQSTPADGAPVTWALTDARYKVRGRTMATFWVDPGDTLDVDIDMGESIDLAGGELDFSSSVVYPNQSSALQVERVGNTALFHVRATPDSRFPLGRMPILFQAHVRGMRSNPVFVNVYWRQAAQLDTPSDYYDSASGLTDKAVFYNARPTLTTSLGAATTLAGAVGVPATFSVTCTDPDGFPTRFYRWADDTGTMTGGVYTLTPTASGNYPVSIVCSDGTGGYASTRVTIEVP